MDVRTIEKLIVPIEGYDGLKRQMLAKPQIGCNLRGRVIRCASTKVGGVVERFPEVIYPRYVYYDYAAYDRELTERFGGRRYWQSNVAEDEAAIAATKDQLETECVST